MRTFEHFPEQVICPICGTNDDKLCVLIPIAGTIKDGICTAKNFHLDCIKLTYCDAFYNDGSILMQNFKNIGEVKNV